MSRIRLGRRSAARTVAALCALAAFAGAGATAGAVAAAASPAAGAAPHVLRPAGVIPVPGDRFAPAGTSVTFLGVPPSALGRLRVVGSRSGLHPGTVHALVGASGSVFTPARPFVGGEHVSVQVPGLVVPGGAGGGYSFSTAVPASGPVAAEGLRKAAAEDTGQGQRAGSARATSSRLAPVCQVATYVSAPTIDAQQACMDLGVTTSGTTPGTYLFLAPGDRGPGIYTDNGQLVWWDPSPNIAVDSTEVQYGGSPYLAVWSGNGLAGYGAGAVTLYNEHYQSAGVVTSAGDFAGDFIDLHEFQVTPQGDALFGSYDPVMVDINGTEQPVLQYVVQKVSLVQTASGIHTGSLLFEWDSLTDVPPSQSMSPDPGTSTAWDYFHGNAITQDTDGNLVVSSRNTWGLYKVDDTVGDASYGHVVWQVGAQGDSQLAVPWCYQHDVTALGNNEYSLFDDGGSGPGCMVGSTQHPARGLIITVSPATTPAGLTLDNAYGHTPAIYAEFTGSTQVLPNGDVLVDWANTPQITEFSRAGAVKMDLSLSSSSYRGFRFAWDGQPLTLPSLVAKPGNGRTPVWVSWNGSTEVAKWQFLAGPGPSSLSPIGAPIAKTTFETAAVLPAEYGAIEVQALSSTGRVLGTTTPIITSGYLLATSTGSVSSFGNATSSSAVAGNPLAAPAVGIARTAGGAGYWLVDSAGGVETFGKATVHGSLAGSHLNAPVVGMAGTPDGNGYWLVASDGGIFTYGDAHFHGSRAATHLNAPVVGMAATPDGKGYWLVAADGGVFTYGDAHFHGSRAGTHLNAPIVAIVATPDGKGYWLVGADGGVFTYGDAHFRGSAVGSRLAKPIVAAAATSDGFGYWLVGAGGAVDSFGGAGFYGNEASGSPAAKVVGIAGG